MIKAVNHVGISVQSLERSIEFYRDLLGLELLGQGAFEGEQYDAILGLEGATGRIALLKLKGADTRFELFEFTSPSPKPAPAGRLVSDHGISHFCLEVADIEGEYLRLKTAGVVFHCPPLKFALTGNKATYARDPDGNVFELLQKASQT